MDSQINIILDKLSSEEVSRIEEFRKAKETGVLSIMFTDIVGSTHANEILGERAYSKLRHIHNDLFIKIVTRDKAGYIIKEIGDSFLCVFSEPSTAVARAVEFQRALKANQEYLTSGEYTLTVRIGIHLGQVAVENLLALDIFGRHVNRAARIEGIATGGLVLTSKSIWENAIGWINDNNDKSIECKKYGKLKLKGINEKVEIYGFFPKEIGEPPEPKVFKKQRIARRVKYISTILILLFASYFVIKNVRNQLNNATSQVIVQEKIKKYLLQFEYSNLEFSPEKDNSLIPQLKEFEDEILSSAITILYPDSVITFLDLQNSLAKKGELLSTLSIKEFKNIKDSFGLSGGFFTNVKMVSRDSIELSINHVLYDSYASYYLTASGYSFDTVIVSDINNEFRTMFQRIMMDWKTRYPIGVVTSVNDSIFLFKLTRNSNMRQGAKVSLHRMYTKDEGLILYLKDIKNRIAFFENKANYTQEVENEKNHYKRVETELAESIRKGASYGEGLHIKGKIFEIYDSIGSVRWEGIYEGMQIAPREGDKIYLEY